jgi:hypothetical protein
VKPYENTERAELKIFNEAIWHRAKRWFVVKLWREGCFFFKADEEDTKLDRCAIEAYEAAISEYLEDNADGAAHITKFRLQPQSTGALVKCRQVVSAIIKSCIHHNSDLSKLLPAAILFMETALDVAREAVANEYGFNVLVTKGKQDVVKNIAQSALQEEVLDHPSIKEVLVVIFFKESDSWGRMLGHLFENKFPLQILALAVALVSRIYI